MINEICLNKKSEFIIINMTIFTEFELKITCSYVIAHYLSSQTMLQRIHIDVDIV